MSQTSEIRIFITPSHICTVYLTMLAKETKKENQIDILLIDASKRKQGLINIITETSKTHQWNLFYDFSIIEGENFDYAPSTKKALVRKIKTWPVVKTFYNLLLERHLKKLDKKYRAELIQLLAPFYKPGQKISLFMLTQTYLNRPLEQLFPEASINYIEHGIGDYYHILNPRTTKGNFYCVFADAYKKYLLKSGNSSEWVRPLPQLDSFPSFAEELLAKYNKSIQLDQIKIPDKPCVFILLEAVDMYQVDYSFWTEYLNHIFTQLAQPDKYHYLLKPHPMQSEASLIATEKHLSKLGYTYTLLNHPTLINASAEVIFSFWKQNTEHVFCLFSSGCFYLSKLYQKEKIQFWYSTEFMSKYLGNAPPQYYKSYTESRKMNDEVFTENCKPY